MNMNLRGTLPPMPPEVQEAVREILHGDDPDKLVQTFEYVLGGNFRCTEVIEATPTKFVCLAERMGKKYDGLSFRAEMAFDLAAGEVNKISLQVLGKP